jgi:hypothetical protein
MFVKLRESGQFGQEIWINPNNVFAVKDVCSTGHGMDGKQIRINKSLVFSGGRYDGDYPYTVVEGSVHEVLAKLNEGN